MLIEGEVRLRPSNLYKSIITPGHLGWRGIVSGIAHQSFRRFVYLIPLRSLYYISIYTTWRSITLLVMNDLDLYLQGYTRHVLSCDLLNQQPEIIVQTQEQLTVDQIHFENWVTLKMVFTIKLHFIHAIWHSTLLAKWYFAHWAFLLKKTEIASFID